MADEDNIYIDHDDLVWFTRELGYKSDNYACYGYAGATIPAILLNDVRTFNLRLYWMKKIKAEVLRTGQPLKQVIIHASVSGIPGQELSNKDKKIIAEISAFCESVEMHYQPEFYSDWYERDKAPQSQNISKTIPLLLPQKLSTMESSPVFTGSYTKEDLEDYFDSFLEALDSRKLYQYRHAKVVLLLSSVGHSMVVSFDCVLKTWTFADICHTPILEGLSTDQIINKVNWYFTDNDISVISTQIFSVFPGTANAVFQCWQAQSLWHDLHKIDKEKVSRLDWNNANWLHVAAQNGDTKTVNAVAEFQGIKFRKFCHNATNRGMTSLQLAVQEGHMNVVVTLLMNGADPNIGEKMTALDYAIEKRDIRLIKLLLIYGGIAKANLWPLNQEFNLAREQLNDYLTLKKTLKLPKKVNKLTVDFTSGRGKALKKLESYAYLEDDERRLKQALMMFERIERVYQSPKFKPATQQQEENLRALSSLIDSAFELFAAEKLDQAMIVFLEQKLHNVLLPRASVSTDGMFSERKKTLGTRQDSLIAPKRFRREIA